jgi:prepilin-type N-terminal cleavage/methylation domain-containing protein
MKFMHDNQKGFTLIELLVVISILAVLAGVVILNVTQYIGRGACEAAVTELHNVQTAVAAYMYDDAAHAVPANTGAMTNYFLNPLTGTYTIDQSTGAVSITAYPGCASLP